MDVFDFDEDDDDGLESPPDSPKRVVKFKQAPASEEPASVASSLAPSKDEPSPAPPSTGPSPQASTATDATNTTSVISVARSNPLRGRGTKHARARERKAAEEQRRKELELQQQQTKKKKPLLKRNRQENNGISPNKNIVRFQNTQSVDNSDDEDYDNNNNNNNEDDGSSSVTNLPPPNRDDVFAAHRKRRKINGKNIKKRIAAGRFGASSLKLSPPDDKNDRHSLMSPPPMSSSSSNHRSSSSHHLSLSEQIQQKLQKHERQQQKIIGPDNNNNDNHPAAAAAVVVVSRKVRGAGQDVYAMQDAGNFQMIHDECAYLTSMIVSCPASHIPAKTGLIDSVAELALLLSDTKTRRTLWGTATTSSSKKATARDRRRQQQKQHKEDQENATLEGILDVLQHTTSALAEKFDSGSHFYALLQKLIRTDPNHDDDDEKKGSYNTNKGISRSNIVETYHKGLLLDSLAAIVSSLSWDCTVDNRASANFQNATGAKSLRRAILQHEGVLTGIMYIIRHADPMVSSILEAQVPEETMAGSSSATGATEDSNKQHPYETQASSSMSSMQQSPSKSKDGRASVASSQDNESVVTTSTKEDPTVAGRRKRKRKKGGSMLDAIAEDESVALSFTGGTTKGTMTPPRSPPRVVFRQPQTSSDSRSKLSFSSEDAMSSPPRSRSPLRRRGMQLRQGLDDDSSMNSCDSTLLKIHDRLGKIRAQFVRPGANTPKQQLQQQHALVNSKSHECQGHRELPLSFGGKDPAGSAAAMVLDALHRLLAGKEEGDTHSCLDDIEEESTRKNYDIDCMSPGSDDEHDKYGGIQGEESKTHATKENEEDELLRNNPLLQTNRMLGDSGVIPSLVQGMAETLSAVIEELDQQRPKSKPCVACMQHLFDKFQGLAPIVDNACLLHDANRTDLCAASIETGDYSNNSSGGTLVGSLVYFLKRWMQQTSRTPKNGKRGPNKTTRLLNEMGLSVLRTLTSLTHDNTLAAEQLAIQYRETSGTGKHLAAKATASWNGVQVVGQVLYSAVTANEASKLAYDTRIFCLNTLANVVGDEPHGDVRRAMLSMKFLQAGPGKGKSSVLFLRWLTQWLMSETESFRDAIMKGSFGGTNASSSVHSERELDATEHEKLMMAGNGCVLLACLLMGPPKSNTIRGTGSPGSLKKKNGSAKSSKMGGSSDSMAMVTQKIREIVLAEMPLDDSGSGSSTGTTFIRNTLRAFSNLLYFSVGDLSVAVVAPVRNLISELEKIQVEVEIVS